MKSFFRICSGLLSLVLACFACARSNIYGGCLDSSENLYTATNYPSPTSLRVLRRDSNGNLVWNTNITAPNGYEYGPITIVRVDSAGDVFVGCGITPNSGTEQAIGILRFTSSGKLTREFFYTPTNYAVQLAGMCLDSSQNLYLIANYSTTSAESLTNSFILQTNNAVTSGTQIPISASQYTTTLATDIVAGAADNVYTGSLCYNSNGAGATVVLTKYNGSTFVHGPTWQAGNSLSANYKFGSEYGNGCLTIDGAGRLTYVVGFDDTLGSSTGRYFVQRSSANALKWSYYFAGAGDSVLASIDDSGGNIISVGPESSTAYQLVKMSTGGILDWSAAFSGVLSQPESIALDAAGTIELVDTFTQGSGQRLEVQLFEPVGGGTAGSYYYEGAGHSDYGRQIFASRYKTGTFYVEGTGAYGSEYLPLNVKVANKALAWYLYQGP